jgi:hypothetical protein
MRLLLLLLIGCAVGTCQVLVAPTGTPANLADPSVSAPAVKPEDKCSIEGAVLNAATGEAVKKASVVLRSLTSMNNSGLGAVSDSAGHFKIEGIDPGRYNLMANRTSFVNQTYGAKAPNRPGTPLTLTPGQNVKDVTFTLTPHGVIIGRVMDEDGDLVANVMLQCQRYMYNRGKKQLVPAGVGNTNDLGEYRIFGLPPGKYYVSAHVRAQDFGPNISDARKDHEEGYAPVYYPNSLTPDAASPLEVTPGAQIRGIDLTLTKTRTVRVRGQVISGVTNKPIRNTNVSLMPRDNSAMAMMNRNFARGLDPKGNFEIHNVLPGSYFVVAQIFEDNKQSMARTPIDVGNSNIDGIRVVVNPMAEVNGRIVVEDNADTKGAVFNVSLEAKTPGPFGGTGTQPAKDDGTFAIRNVAPDTYTVNVFGFRDNFYLKAVRFGDNDVIDSGVDFTQGATASEFTVTLSAAGGQVDGTVQNDKSEPAPGAMVVLIPAAEKRGINRLYKNTSTDQSGKFSIKGIAPGEYKLFAWDQVEFGSYQDPDFLKPYESKGESVSIKENSHESKDLKVITAEETAARP